MVFVLWVQYFHIQLHCAEKGICLHYGDAIYLFYYICSISFFHFIQTIGILRSLKHFVSCGAFAKSGHYILQ